jgi:hypothetical protein
MDEIDKIFIKNCALLKVRDYLLEQAPSDADTIAGLNEYIVDLTACHIYGRNLETVPTLPTAEEQSLLEIIEALQHKLDRKYAPSAIMEEARILYGIKPWPPRSRATSFDAPLTAILGELTSTRGTKLRS